MKSMLALYFSRLALMMPVLAALAVSTAIALAAGLLLRSLRLILFVAPVVACLLLLTPDADEPDVRRETGLEESREQFAEAGRPPAGSRIATAAR